MLARVLTALIVAGYVASLWWLLRRESRAARLGLLAICAAALALRLVSFREYPPGLNEDEPHALRCAVPALQRGELFAQGCTGPPVLLTALFEGQLVPYLGANRWAIRGYSLVAGVLASPAAFAVGRALGLGVAGSLSAAALVAVLPWSILYGRVHQGGELIFHQLLLLAALARLVWRGGGAAEVGIGTLGLTLLLYDYFCGRVMLGMPLVAAVLARGKRRVLAGLILPLALAAWVPYLRDGHPLKTEVVRGIASYDPAGAARARRRATDPRPVPPSRQIERMQRTARRDLLRWVNVRYLYRPVETLVTRTGAALASLAWPSAEDSWLAIRAGGVHPWLVLLLAAAGSLLAVRRGLFLWGGFFGGLVPVVATYNLSTHRLLMAYPFIALAAACALDRLAAVRRGHWLLAATLGLVSVQSVRLFFSPVFWPPEGTWVWDGDHTALTDVLPAMPHPRMVVDPNLRFFRYRLVLERHDAEMLSVDNWIPADGVPLLYLFGAESAALRSFYEEVVGPEHVRAFGRPFLVNVPAGRWSWLRQHGWNYQVWCGTARWHGHVPVLFQPGITFAAMAFAARRACPEDQWHEWRGRWNGPPAMLRLRFSGRAVVETSAGNVVDGSGWTTDADFAVATGQEVRVLVASRGDLVYALLFEVGPEGPRVPAWTRVSPVPVTD